jgi:hypothetical protein
MDFMFAMLIISLVISYTLIHVASMITKSWDYMTMQWKSDDEVIQNVDASENFNMNELNMPVETNTNSVMETLSTREIINQYIIAMSPSISQEEILEVLDMNDSEAILTLLAIHDASYDSRMKMKKNAYNTIH